MQQLLSAFGIDWHLLIAQAVNFAIVLVALTYFLYKPVLNVMQQRKEVVAKGVEDAKLAETKLATADSEAKVLVDTAETEAEGIVANAREVASAEKARLLKEAETRAAAVTRDAEAQAKEMAAQALRNSEQEVARLAILAAEKVMRAKA
ncbi:MAG: atpF [Parcubacteria group bacterium]|nr:atpF [Parcubacteria group bacterium]